MTNPTTGPAKAPGSNEQKKLTPDLASPTTTAPQAVKDPSVVQPKAPSPTAGPGGPVVSVSTPTQDQGVRQPKGDEHRKDAAPASAPVAVRVGGTDTTPTLRAVSSDTPAPAALRSSPTAPGDPRPIGPNDPVKPTHPAAPVQSVHLDQPGAAIAPGDAGATT
jgi:hypothetical protein